MRASFARFAYDAENQLVDYTIPGSYRTAFAYDGRGRLRQRTEYTSAGGTNWTFNVQITYLYDGRRVIQERNGTTPVVAYTRGHDLAGSLEGAGGIGGLLARTHGYSAGNWSTHHCYHADGNGNVTYLVNASQGLGCSYRYRPFGETLSQTSGTPSAGANAYRFSSKEWMATSGLYYYGYRFYQPTLQRWINRDPIGEQGGINLYTFVGNNPIGFADPFGLKDYDCEEVEAILKKLKKDTEGPLGLLKAAKNHLGHGEHDYKAKQDNEADRFFVDGKWMEEDEFGNFAAGYSGEHLGPVGYWGVRAGGVWYDFRDAALERLNDDRDRMRNKGSRGRRNPEPISKFDWDKDSVPDIDAGAQRAKDEKSGKRMPGCP